MSQEEGDSGNKQNKEFRNLLYQTVSALEKTKVSKGSKQGVLGVRSQGRSNRNKDLQDGQKSRQGAGEWRGDQGGTIEYKPPRQDPT